MQESYGAVSERIFPTKIFIEANQNAGRGKELILVMGHYFYKTKRLQGYTF